MKIRLLFSLFAIAFAAFLMSNSGGRASSANDGNTGAPGETGTTCGTCHNGASFNISESLNITDAGGNAITSYLPGETYNVSLVINATGGTPGGYAFQLTSLASNNTDVGAWQNLASNVKSAIASNIGGRTYLEHNGGISASNTFSMEWVAPASGTGDVSFYFAGNAVNGTGSTAGDKGSTGSVVSLSEGVAVLPLAGSASVDTNVSCNGETDGSATAAGADGVPPYSYLWSNNQTGATATNLSAGTYTVSISDDNNAMVTSVVTITEPTAIMASASTTTNAVCNGGSEGEITATASGGTPPYTYAPSLTELSAGDYTITVTDANNCTATASATITEPAAIDANTDVTHASSVGASDGSIDITITGGNAPYTYSWSNGAMTEDISGLIPDTYTCMITDANGCMFEVMESVSFPFSVSLADAGIDALDIFPNPASQFVDIRLSMVDNVQVTLDIVDIYGRTVRQFAPQGGRTIPYHIDVSNLANGIYFARFSANDVSITKKIVVNK